MRISKRTLNKLFFLCGLAACIVMLLTFDVSFIELWQHLCHAGYWLLPIIGIWVIVYAVNAASWWCVIKGVAHNPKISPLRIFKLTITGYALNYATPVGGLGGEPYRIMELSQDIGNEKASSSVILYAMMHMFAHCWFWFTSIFLYLALASIGDLPLNVPITCMLGFIAILFFAALYFFSKGYSNGLVVKTLTWTSKIPGLGKWSHRTLTNHNETLHNIDKQIATLFSKEKKAFFSSLLLEYLSRLIQSLEVFFMLILFGVNDQSTLNPQLSTLIILYLHSILIVALTSFFANLIGFLPMQLGVQEGGFVLSIAALGLAPAVGIFVSIICRVREIFWIFIGIMLMLRTRT